MIQRQRKTRGLQLLALSLLLTLLVGCTRLPVTVNHSLLGTEVSITVHDIDSRLKGKLVYAAIESAFVEIERVEDLCKWNQLKKLNGYAGYQPYPIGQELMGLIDHAYDVAAKTEGAFRPDTGPLVNLWKIGTDYARIPEPYEIDEALQVMNNTVFTPIDSIQACLDPGRASIELGGIAKGYAVDRACEVLMDLGVKAGMVWAGGDLRVFGAKRDGTPWRIAVRHPRKPNEFLRVLEIREGAVATSGDYERYSILEGGKYCHIFDPWQGMPSRASISSTVVMQTCMDADAYATAMFVLGPEEGIHLADRLAIPTLIADEPGGEMQVMENELFRQFVSE